MVIQKSALKAWQNRPLRSSAAIKRKSEARIDKAIAGLDPAPVFHTELRKAQKVGFWVGLKYPGYLFLMDMGTGKTKLALDLARHLIHQLKEVERFLILVPATTNIQDWEEQIHEHAPDLTYSLVVGKPEDRKEAMLADTDLVICTYAGYRAQTTSIGPNKKTGKSEQKRDPKKSAPIEKRFTGLIADESSMIGNNQSITFRLLRQLRKRCRRIYALTGTPFDAHPDAAWTQFYVVDGGETLGKTLGLYRETFYRLEESHWSDYGKWVFDRRKVRQLRRMMRHRSIRYSSKECGDMPKVSGGLIGGGYMLRKVSFSAETQRYYDKVRKDLEAAQGNFTLVDNVYRVMRGIASGYLPVIDPSGERIQVTFKENPKLDRIVEMLGEIPSQRKAIVYAHYNASIKLISERLKKEKISHVVIGGGKGNKIKALTRFKRDPKCRVLVGSSAISRGLNLWIANYLFFFECPDRHDDRKQIEMRLPRGKQEHKVFIYDVVVEDSIDMRLLRRVRDKKTLFDGLFDED